MAPERAEVETVVVTGVETVEVVKAVARVEVAMEGVAMAVAETAGGAKGVGAMGAGTAEAATAVGATATRTWKRCAPRQGSRCDSFRAERW